MSEPSPIEDLAIIDVDAHITEPYDLWTSRAPAAYKDRVPRFEQRGDKGGTWVVDGDVELGGANPASVVARDGTKSRGPEFFAWSIDDVHVASYDMKARVEVLDSVTVRRMKSYWLSRGFDSSRLIRPAATIFSNSFLKFAGFDTKSAAPSSSTALPLAVLE